MAEQRAVCAAVPVRALLQLPLLGVERGYKGLYGGGWPLRGIGAAGTALGAADARTNEHYEIGTILTQFSHGVTTFDVFVQASTYLSRSVKGALAPTGLLITKGSSQLLAVSRRPRVIGSMSKGRSI